MSKKIEIMAPAGSFDSLMAAIQGRADSVYFGIEQLNMRAKAKNFQVENLPEIIEYCKTKSVKTYLTITIMQAISPRLLIPITR